MKNVQKPEKIPLGKLIDEIKKGKFVIPDFQREFEWRPWDVNDLIKSIFMDYYIGTLLLWDGKKESFKALSCEKIQGFKGSEDPTYIVLDGQQRLTALYYAFFGPDVNFPRRRSRFYFYLRITDYMEENFDEAFYYYRSTTYYKKLLADVKLQYEENIFPLKYMQDGGWEISDWVKGYKDYWQDKLDNYENYKENSKQPKSKEQIKKFIDISKPFDKQMEELLRDYQISYIELTEDIPIGKVCDIFTQINSRGVRLDIFDLLNAILRPKSIYLKNMWQSAEPTIEFGDAKKMKNYVLQVMSILAQTYCSPQYLYYLVPDTPKTIKKPDGSKEQIVLIKSEKEFIKKWNEAVAIIQKTLKTLKNPRDFGAIKEEFIPYPSIIPVLAAIKKYVEGSDLNNKIDINDKIKKWYWASVFQNRYSSAVESTSAKDFTELRRWFTDDDGEPEFIIDFIADYKNLRLKEEQKGSAIYNAIFNLLILNEARDWETFDLPEYETLNDHHIVPYSWGKKEVGSDINSILNRTPLSEITNKHVIGDNLPNLYLKKMLRNNDAERVYKVLASHLITKEAVQVLLRNPFTKDDYYEFIEIRRKEIIRFIEDRIINDEVKLPANLKRLDNQIEEIEIGLRELLNNTLGNSQNPFKEFVTSQTQLKVADRIRRAIKKNPAFTEDSFNTFRSKLNYFDLMELHELLVNKSLWNNFENIFRGKEQLSNKFNQLAELRNSIRHSRSADEVTIKEGEAAIIWFKKALKL
ncbi:GmrSD restriction endonuclease domain-containing protein [Immundisolibacter sp.]